ncbi:MAG: helix-turn-helix domain-containing protein [Clostridiales bacterium]|nr:helix-turn-helix domain-containing protein [Clostridiales bacterium]
MSILGERFFKLSNALFCYHLTPIQFTVYSFLVSSAGRKEKCWPSMKTIAASCGCSQNAAREAIGVLEQRGFIRRVKRY